MCVTPTSRSSTARGRALELLEEIEILQRRLEVMGMDGDCAYEHAISSLYQRMVEERQAQLKALQLAHLTEP